MRTRYVSALVIVATAIALGLIATLGAALAQSTGAVTTVPSVDLDRYLGRWYELARYPNRFQRQCAGEVRATYAKRDDGRIAVLNECRTVEGRTDSALGVARVVDMASRARLKVRFAPAFLSFLPMVWGDYWVIGLAADYAWAVVGSPDRNYLWILARTPALSEGRYEQALERVRANGFDPDRLMRTRQNP
jgi:apolipoprotein D and lipocalin family protein